MKRRENTIDLYLQDVGTRTIEVEFSVPNFGWGEQTWYVPVTFLPKRNVAPDLEVTDADGGVIAIPTKRQNFALTRMAVDHLVASGRVNLGVDPALRQLIDEVITRIPLHARVCRYLFNKAESVAHKELADLLGLLEDHFVLWVPVKGAPQSHHFLRVSRQEIRPPEPIVVRRQRRAETVETAMGSVRIEATGVGGWPRPTRGAPDRLLKTLALRPIEGKVFEFEAKRATSSHLRVNAPTGFLVRNIRVGEISPTSGPTPVVREMNLHEENVVIQGWDQNLAHVHLSRDHNPEQFYCRVTLGLRGGVNTLWMLSTLFTAALLWVVHHHSRYGPLPVHDLPQHFQFALERLREGHVHRHLRLGSDNKQIAAAVLLVGPAAASAWSLRSDGGELLRSVLAGSRVLLLLSAAISIAAALALGGILPGDSGRYAAVELYAAASYFVAVPMVVAWILASRPTWDLFRSLLNTEGSNLLAIAAFGLVVLVIGRPMFLPHRTTGAILLLCGIGLGALAANSTAVPLTRRWTLYRPLATAGALPLVLVAGRLLSFYSQHLSLETARMMCLVIGFLLAGIALIGWFFGTESGRSLVFMLESRLNVVLKRFRRGADGVVN